MSAYTAAVRDLACDVVDLMAEGLLMADTSAFSKMIRADDGDSILRLNYYPRTSADTLPPVHFRGKRKEGVMVGFGEHSDPQILTILRSNDVDGLQISVEDGVWIPVPADPSAFWVNVGDTLQVSRPCLDVWKICCCLLLVLHLTWTFGYMKNQLLRQI